MGIIGRVVKRGAAVTVLVVAATTTVGPLVSEAQSVPAALRVLHWNIAGATINPFDPDKPDNEGTFEVVRRLVDEVDSTRPHLISMNETCRLQAQFAAQQLTDRVGPVALAFADVAGNNFLCAAGGVGPSTDIGNALIAVGADAVWQRQVLYFRNDGSITSEQTERVAVCMLVSFRSTLDEVVRACSAHFETDEAIARAQATAFANFMIENGGPYPIVLAGDFNVTPDVLQDVLYAPAQNGQGEFVEVDHPQDESTFRDGRKIDYIFGDQDHFLPVHTGVVIPSEICPSFPFSHPCSDHSKLFGQLVFREDAPTPPDPEEPPDPVPEPPADMAPFVTAGPAVTGAEGAELDLFGAADDDHGMPAVTWSYENVAGVDPGTTCTVAEPHRTRTTITCTDDGVFRATLTADDGVNDPVSSNTTVTVENVAPTLRLSDPAAWEVFRAGTSVEVTAPFTDPGANDTHSCEVDWDDGVRETYAATDQACSRSHTFGSAGMYTIDLTVTDDDGGSNTATVMVVVYDPDAGFVTGGGSFDSPPGALTTNPSVSGRARFNLNPKYQPHDEGPVPGNGKVAFSLDSTGCQLESTAFEWLVVTPDGKAAVKGIGTLAGVDGFGFVFYAYDEPDQVRLVIWSLEDGPTPDSGAPIYDNSAMASFDLDDAQPSPITGGSIVIHNSLLDVEPAGAGACDGGIQLSGS